MLNIGQLVLVLPPFDAAFPGEHLITDIVQSDDGTTAYILGDMGGFDIKYLVAA